MVNTAWRGPTIQLPSDDSERVGPMSDALWCDINDKETNTIKGIPGHPFSDKDPNRRHFTQTQEVNVETGNSYGRPTYQERKEVTETVDMCGYHWQKQNPFQQGEEPNAIEAAEDEAEQSEAEMWRAKYEAERARNL